MANFPKYKDLQRPDDVTGLPLSWGTWGREDQIGTLNNITEGCVVEAARLVERGVRFNLDLPLHMPFGVVKPNAHPGGRQAPEQTLIVRERESSDLFGHGQRWNFNLRSQNFQDEFRSQGSSKSFRHDLR